jgi:hypothetical protein
VAVCGLGHHLAAKRRTMKNSMANGEWRMANEEVAAALFIQYSPFDIRH